MKEIPLTRGLFTLVDDEDYEALIQYKWQANSVMGGRHFYARRNWRGEGSKPCYTLMHRAIMNAPKGMDVDHIDGDRLNNTRSNLRIVTRSQNLANRGSHGIHGFKGIRIVPKNTNKPYGVYIGHNYKQIYLGSYSTVIEAALAYDRKAKELYGDFARLNIPETLF